jgi:hypothetical protein
LRIKLKESNTINEELKSAFKKNFLHLETSLKECVEGKDKLMNKKFFHFYKIKTLCFNNK